MPQVRPKLQQTAMRPLVLLGLAAMLLSTALPLAPVQAQIPHFERGMVDLVVVRKSARSLQLMRAGRVVKSYRIALGREPAGPKRQEGDGRTPEGVYTLDWRNANSAFHRSIHVSYPRAGDDDHALRWGVSAGGLIMLHGLPNGVPAERVGHPEVDWTDGCIALTNDEIDEIWSLVEDGTTIIIYP
jgi:murein L,D-transpeptidase YafK